MNDTQLIKDKLDIVDFISEYVRLKSAGVNHKGLCPFHNESTPSFMASRERQSFKCFGCGKGGDIFTFVQEMEGMEFVEVLKMLADKAGVTLTRQVNEVNTSQKNRLKDINLVAARFFHNILVRLPAAEDARIYLKNRGITDQTIEEWQIGFIPEQWDLLTKYLLKKGFSIDDLIASGMTIKRDGADAASGRGFYDRFRGRIMFPIRDVHGSVVGFTGRVLVETEKSGGKYVNTPQTAVYDKSRVVFGLDKAKREIKNKDMIVMVEGQVDVIACYQSGMKNVVATSGTALTDMQVRMIKRYSTNMNMAFDSDDAGQKAAKRGIDIALAEGMHVKVISIPEGKGTDPDECVSNYPDVWFFAVENAKDVMRWYLDKAFLGMDLSLPRTKQEVADKLLPEISRIPYAVERDYWMRELSAQLGVDVSVLRHDALRLSDKEGVRHNSIRRKDVIDGGFNTIKKDTKDRFSLLLEKLFALFTQFPNDLAPCIVSLDSLELSTSEYLSLYEAIKVQYTEKGSIDIDLLNEQLSDVNPSMIDNLLLQSQWEFSSISAAKALVQANILVSHIREESKKIKRNSIQSRLQIAERDGDRDAIRNLMEEFKNL